MEVFMGDGGSRGSRRGLGVRFRVIIKRSRGEKFVVCLNYGFSCF